MAEKLNKVPPPCLKTAYVERLNTYAGTRRIDIS
tara:strand:- start:63 stop:164 length:102 start_codon:yes stop_codon:yes gene_type:complete